MAKKWESSGVKIENINHLMQVLDDCGVVIWHGNTKNRAFIESWQLHMILTQIERGNFEVPKRIKS